MKFIIITKYESYITEAEDFDDAVAQAWDDHTGDRCINAIIKIPEDI